MPRVILIAALFGTTLLAEPVQRLTPAEPSKVGMSPRVLDAAKMLYSEAVARGDIAGVVLLVARHGKVVLHEAFGWRDRDNHVRMTTDTLFDIASMTKPIVATAVLILAERHQLNLDDPVSKYIPEFSIGRSNRVTIRQLINHTSGLRIADAFVGPLRQRSPEFPSAPSLQVEVARYPAIGPAEEPGMTYSYSNAGYNALAAVLEVASGKPLHELLQDLLYQPLGMADTFQLFGSVSDTRLAKQYQMQQHELVPAAPPLFPFAVGSGKTASTAMDYAKFCQMYLNGGTYAGGRVLAETSVRRATSVTVRTPYIMPDPKQLQERGLQPRWYYRRDGRALGIDIGYGLGWVLSADGVYSHPGVTGTYAWVDPTRDLIGVILTQSNDARNPGIEFVEVVNAAIDSGRR